MKQPLQTFCLWSLGICLSLIVLQLIPQTGIFLMFVGGYFWTGLSLLAFIFGLMLACYSRQMPRWLAIVPIVFFGGYYSLYFSQLTSILKREAELQQSNPGQVMKIDFDSQALVTPNAEVIVMNYAVPVAYLRNKNVAEEYLSFRILLRSDCDAIPRDSLSFIYTLTFRTTNKQGRQTIFRDLCNLRFPEKPIGERIEVAIEGAKTWKRQPGFKEGSVTLRRAGRDLAIYRTAYIYRYKPFPFPYFWCGLNSSAPSWDCDWGFSKSLYKLDVQPRDGGPVIEKDPVAILLGLKPYSPADIRKFKVFSSNTSSLKRLISRE